MVGKKPGMLSLMRFGLILGAMIPMIIDSLNPLTVHATGVGLGVSSFDATIDMDEKDSSYGSTSSGLNFILDTAVAKRKVFNYRLSLGYEEQKIDHSAQKIQRIAIGNTFGFGVVQSNFARIYLGPRLDFGLGFDNNQSKDYANFNIGVAPVLGVNFHLGPVVSLGLELGYEFGFYLETDTEHDHTDSGTRVGPFVNAVLFFRTSGDRYQAAE